jgi:hypothetical protein
MSSFLSTFATDGLREYVQMRLVAAMNLCLFMVRCVGFRD